MNKRFILVLVVMILFLGFSIYQYVTVFHSELANAYTIKPANGHSWSEMECTTGLCVTADNKVGMGTDSPIEKLSVVGNISATGTIKATGNISTSGTLTATGDVCSNGGTNCLSSGTPSGAIMFFNLASCPSGWTELTAARGRYLVGLTSGGTLAGTAGTALTNLENRAVVAVLAVVDQEVASNGSGSGVTHCVLSANFSVGSVAYTIRHVSYS